MTLPDIGRRHPTPYFGFLQRIDEDELNFRFVHSLTGRIILDGGRAWGKKDWTIRVRINEESGQVVWQLLGTTADVPITFFPGDPLGPVQTVTSGGRVIAGTLDYPHRPFTVLIEGEGVKTAIDPLGQVEWITADQGWILIGTNRGGLIIVSVKNN
ncbi:MAG: hypothetical protein DDT36_01507 [Firmicutes bacterium]|nr:hypothetical protein [Bacillota bacterium]